MANIFDRVARQQFNQQRQLEPEREEESSGNIFDRVASEQFSGEPSVIPVSAQSTITPQVQEQPQQDSGVLSNIGASISDRFGKTKEFAQRQVGGGILQQATSPQSIFAVGASQAAGVGMDVAGDLAVRALKKFTPDPVKEAVVGTTREFLQTPIGRSALGVLKAGGEAYSKFAEKFPDAAISLDSLLNITGMGVTGKGAKPIVKEVMDIGSDISLASAKITAPAAQSNIKNIVRQGMNKAIKPLRKKGGFSLNEKQIDKASTAVQSIVNNKKGLTLVNEFGEEIVGEVPKNLSQMAQSIEQVKRKVFTEYDQLAQSLGDGLIQLDDIKNTVRKEIAKLNKSTVPNDRAINHAEKFRARLDERGALTATEMQEEIATLNGKLSTFLANPSVGAKGETIIDNEVVMAYRKLLDNTITKKTGSQYSALKKEYGALASIEDSVGKALHKDLQKANVSFADLVTDLASGTQMAYAVSTQNAALAAASVTSKAIGKFHKIINDPNKTVRNMFNATEKILDKAKKAKLGKGAPPKSVIIGAVNKGIKKVSDAVDSNPQFSSLPTREKKKIINSAIDQASQVDSPANVFDDAVNIVKKGTGHENLSENLMRIQRIREQSLRGKK